MKMTIKAKYRIILFLMMLVVTNIMLASQGLAIPLNDVTELSASYSSGSVAITGTTSPGVLAVALQVYDTDGTTLLRMQSCGVTNQAFSATIEITLLPGTYTVKAADYEGGAFTVAQFTYIEPDDTDNDTGDLMPAPTPMPTPIPTYKAEMKEGSSQTETLQVAVDPLTKSGLASIGTTEAGRLLGSNTGTTVAMPSIPGVDAYTLELPANSLSGAQGTGTVTLSANAGSITFSGNMLSSMRDMDGKTAGITIGTGDKTDLTEKEKEAIGDKPLIQLTFTLDGEQTRWDNPLAPITVSIPYTPTADELKNPENIVIWYIDGSGMPVCVPDGCYDPATDKVTFSTTHFSYYAVGYNLKNFNDVEENIWYSKPIAFIAARSITDGTGEGRFSPDANTTRGEFIVMLMRAYSIAPGIDPKDNFSDAGNTWYTGYLGVAKRLGISGGTGNNMFSPENEITRQEAFTMLYNALKAMDRLPEDTGSKALTSFGDAQSVATWASEAIDLLVRSGVVKGYNGRLLPGDKITRAQIAQLLYNLLSK